MTSEASVRTGGRSDQTLLFCGKPHPPNPEKEDGAPNPVKNPGHGPRADAPDIHEYDSRHGL